MKTLNITALRLRWKILLYLLLINGMLFLLYHKFIIGNGIYLYSDVGSDAFTSSFPIISMLARLFQEGSFPQYELTAGIGSNIAATFLQYLNPIKTFLLFFNNETLPLGILLYLLLQTNITAIGGYGFFRAFLKDEDAAFIPAIIWTFTGYNVLWTQNLTFGVCIMMFTLTIWALYHHLEQERFGSWLLLIFILVMFLLANYYFFYTTGVFTIFFVIGYSLRHHEGFRRMLKRLIELFFAAVFTILICAMDIAAILSVFSESSRGTEASQTAFPGLFLSGDSVLTTVGRIFSPNLFGTGDDYSAYSNYYEAACLFVGILFLYAVIYLLLQKSTRIRTLLLVLASALLLVMPLTGLLLNLSYHSQRYVFLFVFLETMAIGEFSLFLFHSPDKNLLKKTIFAGSALLVVLMGLTYVLSGLTTFSVNKRALIFIVFFALVYIGLLTVLFLINNKLQTVIPWLLTLVVAMEMVIANYDSVNYRSYVTRDVYEYSFFNDGMPEAVEEIRKRDDSLYRIIGDSDPSFANAGMVNNFNALSAYSSTLQSDLIHLSMAQLNYQVTRNHFLVDYEDYIQYTLLSGKYLLDDGYDYFASSMEPSLFKEVLEVSDPDHGIDKFVFENEYALPFGYLYTSQISLADYQNRDLNSKLHLLTKSYYETEEEDSVLTDEGNIQADSMTDERIPLLPLLAENNDTVISEENETITLTRPGDAANLIFDIEKAEGDEDLQYLHLSLADFTQVSDFMVYPLTESEPIARSEYAYHFVLSAQYPETSILMPDDLIGIRIDMGSEIATLNTLELINCNDIQSNLAELGNTDIADASFENNTYTATVTSEEGGMLCVPLIYSEGWSLEVNGEERQVHNINGGLVGVPLTGGMESISLRYEIPHFMTGRIISIISFAVYITLVWHDFFKRRKRIS